MTSYWFAHRPQGVEHHHPFLVFDSSDHLHFPLTVFGKEVGYRLSPKTVQRYLHAILPVFTWLDIDVWQARAGITWNAAPMQIRQAVEDYLVQKLQCKVQTNQQSWRLVTITTGARNTLRGFLSVLKPFYKIMVFSNRLGEIRDRSYEDQRYRASGLNLVVAAIILWNTVYLAEAVETLKNKGVEVKEEYLQHLSPRMGTY